MLRANCIAPTLRCLVDKELDPLGHILHDANQCLVLRPFEHVDARFLSDLRPLLALTRLLRRTREVVFVKVVFIRPASLVAVIIPSGKKYL